MSFGLEQLGSPTAVIGFGATTLVLLGTTYYFIKSNEKSVDSRRGGSSVRNGTANGSMNGHVKKVKKELDRTVGYLALDRLC